MVHCHDVDERGAKAWRKGVGRLLTQQLGDGLFDLGLVRVGLFAPGACHAVKLIQGGSERICGSRPDPEAMTRSVGTGSSHIVMGRTQQPSFRRWFGQSILDQLLRDVPGVDITVIDGE